MTIIFHQTIKKEIVNINKKNTELGEVIKNSNLERKTKENITVCDLTETGVQDTTIARHTFDIATSNI